MGPSWGSKSLTRNRFALPAWRSLTKWRASVATTNLRLNFNFASQRNSLPRRSRLRLSTLHSELRSTQQKAIKGVNNLEADYLAFNRSLNWALCRRMLALSHSSEWAINPVRFGPDCPGATVFEVLDAPRCPLWATLTVRLPERVVQFQQTLLIYQFAIYQFGCCTRCYCVTFHHRRRFRFTYPKFVQRDGLFLIEFIKIQKLCSPLLFWLLVESFQAQSFTLSMETVSIKRFNFKPLSIARATGLRSSRGLEAKLWMANLSNRLRFTCDE